MHPGNLAIFVISRGEHSAAECIDRLRQYSPLPQTIYLWQHGLDGDGITPVVKPDMVIRTSENMGANAALGFAMLYLPFDHILLTVADLWVERGYWDYLWQPFQNEERLAVSGLWSPFSKDKERPSPLLPSTYVLADEKCLPDGVWLISKKAIEEVGAVSPRFGKVGHEMLDFMLRCLWSGWKIASICVPIVPIANHTGHAGRALLADYESQMSRSQQALADTLAGKYGPGNWWKVAA